MTFIERNKIPLLLLLLGLVLFANTMDAERLFSWDDNRYLEENKLVQDFEVGKIFSQSYFGAYIPVTLFSFALEHKLWGLRSSGYHVVNVILHAFNGVLVFFLLFHFIGRRTPAAIAAALFIVHPVQVETVAWISERKNLFSMFFFLLAFLSHGRYRHDDSIKWQYAAWLFYLLSVLSKPIVVGAPLLFMAYDLFWARVSLRRAFISALPALAIAFFGAVTILISSAKVGGIKGYWGGSHWSALQLAFLIAWQYLVGLIDPSTLSIHYVYAPDAIKANWRVWAGFALLVCFMALGVQSLWRFLRNREHKPILFFMVLWVTVFMLPVSNIVPLSIQRADRFIYFPSVMIFLAIGWMWDRLWQRHQVPGIRYVLLACIVAVTVIISSITYNLNQVWNNSGSLWTYQLTKYPDDDIAINNLAMFYFRTKQYPQAKEVYAALSRLTPQNFRPFLFLGLIAFEEERYPEAIRYLHRASLYADTGLAESIKVQLLSAYSKAVAQAKREGRFEDVVGYYHEVVEILPDNRSVYNDLGKAYADMGNVDAAIAAYRRAMSVSQGYYSLANANMGFLLFKRGLIDEAQAIFEEGLSKEPTALAASGKCKVLSVKGRVKEALEACYSAVAFSPDTGEFYQQLAELLLTLYNSEGALSHAAKRLDQNQDLLKLVCGYIHARNNQHKSAIESFRQAGSILAQLELAKSALAIEAYPIADTAFKQVLESNPDLSEAIGGRCIASTHMQDLGNALSFCKSACTREPKNTGYQIAYADLLVASQLWGDAVPFYERALENGANEVKPKLAAAYYQLGFSAEASALTGDAIKLYRKAIVLNPYEKTYHYSLGCMFLRQLRYEEALIAFDAAIQLDAKYALAFANKGKAAYALGEKEIALNAYERALEIDNSLAQALEGYCTLLRATGGNAAEVCRKARDL